MSLIVQLEKINRRKINALKKSGRVVEGEMHKLVARKTGALDKSIETKPVEKTATGYQVRVGTNLNYAKFVERGVKGRKYNYSRDGKVVYSGVGQKFAKRALKNKKDEVINILKNS